MKIRVRSRDIEVTHPEKIWFPQPGYTKQDIVTYYADIAPLMVPFTQHRPLTMLRYPDGITGESFYHKDMPDYFPSWIESVEIPKLSDGSTRYVLGNTPETLVYIATQGSITPHIWLSTVSALNYPDKLIFDLDPSTEHDFALVKRVAKQLYSLIESIKITPYLMTTGSRGLHVVVPLTQQEDFDTVRGYALQIAQHIVAQNPDSVTLESRKEKRQGRLLIDIMRNAFAQTAVAPFAVRARAQAPVATPLAWDELDNSRLRADLFTIKTIFKRLEKQGNVWEHAPFAFKQ